MTDVLDVLIIGAGWAGMGAADHLVRASSETVNWAILESSDHTGGRTNALAFGDESVGTGSYIVERGSNWVCGYGGGVGGTGGKDAWGRSPNVATNPVWDLAVRAGLETTLIPGSTQNMSNYAAVYDADGNDADADGKIRQAANDALDCMNATAVREEISNSATTREILSQCGWNPKTEAEWAVDWVATVDDPGYPSEEQAAVMMTPDESYMWWGKDDMFVVDQHPRGYARLIDEMVKDTIPEGDERVIFDAHVVDITYSDESDGCADEQVVTVRTRDGRTFRAKELISTIPLGVLRNQHESLFTPALPKKLASVLESDGVIMANLTHVLFQFPTVWWDDSLTRWVSANHGANDTATSGEWSEWQNLNHESMGGLKGSQTLLSFLGDPQSTYYEALDDAEVEAAAMARLREQHPSIDIPDPVDFFMSRHGYDEKSFGAYSGFTPDWKETDHRHLTKSLTDCNGDTRVRWAGEATCYDMGGYTHGGRQSGVEAAANYLYDHGLGPNPSRDDSLSLCDW